MDNFCGIYCITNLITGQCYIGSSLNIKKRISRHITELKTGVHHSILLQRSWIKYSEDAFDFSIIKLCDKNLLLTLEQYYVNNSNSFFNILKDVSKKGGVWLKERSKEMRNKIRQTRLSKPETINRSPVIMIDKETNEIIREFESCCEAAIAITGKRINNSGVNSAARRGGIGYGYKWVFKNKINDI